MMLRRYSSTLIQLETLPSGISILTLNRPAQRNALSTQLLSEFQAHLNYLHTSSTRVVVLRSAVPNIFCAGADLKERLLMTSSQSSAFVTSLRSCFTSFANLPMPTIASIDGFALGGGLELALAADLRVAGPRAKLGFPETALAIMPGAGGTQRLARLIGVAKAKELIFTGDMLDNKQALHFGVISRSVDEDSFAYSIKLAEQLLKKGPIGLKMAKRAIDMGAQLEIANGMLVEELCYEQLLSTKDRVEGLKAFQEKRSPVYKGE